MRMFGLKNNSGYLFAGLSVLLDMAKMYFHAPMAVVVMSLVFIGVISWMYHVNMVVGGGAGKERRSLSIVLVAVFVGQALSLLIYIKEWQESPVVLVPYLVIFSFCAFVLYGLRAKNK